MEVQRVVEVILLLESVVSTSMGKTAATTLRFDGPYCAGDMTSRTCIGTYIADRVEQAADMIKPSLVALRGKGMSESEVLRLLRTVYKNCGDFGAPEIFADSRRDGMSGGLTEGGVERMSSSNRLSGSNMGSNSASVVPKRLKGQVSGDHRGGESGRFGPPLPYDGVTPASGLAQARSAIRAGHSMLSGIGNTTTAVAGDTGPVESDRTRRAIAVRTTRSCHVADFLSPVVSGLGSRGGQSLKIAPVVAAAMAFANVVVDGDKDHRHEQGGIRSMEGAEGQTSTGAGPGAPFDDGAGEGARHRTLSNIGHQYTLGILIGGFSNLEKLLPIVSSQVDLSLSLLGDFVEKRPLIDRDVWVCPGVRRCWTYTLRQRKTIFCWLERLKCADDGESGLGLGVAVGKGESGMPGANGEHHLAYERRVRKRELRLREAMALEGSDDESTSSDEEANLMLEVPLRDSDGRDSSSSTLEVTEAFTGTKSEHGVMIRVDAAGRAATDGEPKREECMLIDARTSVKAIDSDSPVPFPREGDEPRREPLKEGPGGRRSTGKKRKRKRKRAASPFASTNCDSEDEDQYVSVKVPAAFKLPDTWACHVYIRQALHTILYDSASNVMHDPNSAEAQQASDALVHRATSMKGGVDAAREASVVVQEAMASVQDVGDPLGWENPDSAVFDAHGRRFAPAYLCAVDLLMRSQVAVLVCVDHFLLAVAIIVISSIRCSLFGDVDGLHCALQAAEAAANRFLTDALPMFSVAFDYFPEFIDCNIARKTMAGLPKKPSFLVMREIVKRIDVMDRLLSVVSVVLLPRRILCHPECSVKHVSLSTLNPQYVLTSGYDCAVRLFNVNTRRCMAQFSGHQSVVTCAYFTAEDKYVLSGSMDHTIRLWRTSTGECVDIFYGHEAGVLSLDLSRDRKSLFVSGSVDCTVRVWSLKTRRVVRVIDRGFKAIVPVVRFTANSWVAAGSVDGDVMFWEYVFSSWLRAVCPVHFYCQVYVKGPRIILWYWWRACCV